MVSFLLLIVFALTCILESLIALIFVLCKKAPKKIFLAILIGNLISWPTPVFIGLITDYPLEIIVFIFEALIIKLITKKDLNWARALLISLLMNAFSFGAGLIFLR